MQPRKPTTVDAPEDEEGEQAHGQSAQVPDYLSIYNTEQEYQEEYTPLKSLLIRLYTTIGTTILAFILYGVAAYLAKKKGGWTNLCIACCNKGVPQDQEQINKRKEEKREK